jgi:hypothetical protein
LHTSVGVLMLYLKTYTDRFTDTEGTFRPERIKEIAERFGGRHMGDPKIKLTPSS